MRPLIGYFITSLFAVANASAIVALGFAPHPVSNTSILHRSALLLITAQKQKPATLLFVGDIMLDRQVRERMRARGAEYPFALLSTITAPVRADIQIGNLEGAVSVRRPPVKENDFAFATSTVAILKAAGFTAVSLANNHTLDQGAAGYEDTKRALAAAEIGFFGHSVRDDLPPAIVEIRGRRIAFLGYSIVDNPLDERSALAAIRSARTGADTVVVMPHWGAEYALTQNEKQKMLARKFIDAGADAVIGGHPHVVQGIEIYKNKPIVYSLGNFVFDQYFSEDTEQGIVVAITVGQKITLTVIPVQSVQSQPRRMEVEPARKFLSALVGRSSIPKEIFANSIGTFIRGLDRGELVLTW